MNSKIPCALTVAGSDSCGGAGIQADLKTFTALKVYGQSVITSLTAQNTVGVSSIYDLPVDFIESQFDTVMDDIGCDAVKIGMLSNINTVKLISKKLTQYKITKTVLDPVMVSKNGSKLLNDDAVSELINTLLPQCYLVTPNIPEAEIITGVTINNLKSMKQAAENIKNLGCRFVFLTGGHMDKSGFSNDILFDGNEFKEYGSKRVKTKNTHGTGCTISSAVCAYLAKNYEIRDAVAYAKNYIFQAINNNLNLGKGNGPLNHMWNLN